MPDFEQYVEDLAFDSLLIEADNLGVPHDEECWLDDDYPDKEDALRVEVINALNELGAKASSLYIFPTIDDVNEFAKKRLYPIPKRANP